MKHFPLLLLFVSFSSLFFMGCSADAMDPIEVKYLDFFDGQYGGDVMQTNGHLFQMILSDGVELTKSELGISMAGTGMVYQIVFLSSTAIDHQPDCTTYEVSSSMQAPSVIEGQIVDRPYFSLCYILEENSIKDILLVSGGEMVISDNFISCTFNMSDDSIVDFLVPRSSDFN